MRIELAGKYSDVNISVTHNGGLELEFKSNFEVFNSILEAIYTEMPMDAFIKTLDYEQIKAISEYFETIKDK